MIPILCCVVCFVIGFATAIYCLKPISGKVTTKAMYIYMSDLQTWLDSAIKAAEEQRPFPIERVKSLVFRRLNSARDRRDKKAIELYLEIQEAMQ